MVPMRNFAAIKRSLYLRNKFSTEIKQIYNNNKQQICRNVQWQSGL
jgi:hypothetical protein